MDDLYSEPRRNGMLDPQNWDRFDELADEVLTKVIERLFDASTGPVWREPPADLIAKLDKPLPGAGQSQREIVGALLELLPYGVGNTHPRFFGWVHGAGSPGNLLAEIAAAGMNANCGGRNHIAIRVERQVIAWMRDLFGFPDTASGLVVSGTSMATIIAAKAARDAAIGASSRTDGVGDQRLVGYVSSEAHSCLDRAFDMLGLGTAALRKIPVNSAFEIDLDALRDQIAEDRAAGLTPFFLGGTAGTVNTAAIDDLKALSAVAQEEALWFHVDGAFGACIQFSDVHKSRLDGIEAADSLAFDFHKWLHVNYDAGCVLIRSEAAHRNSFAKRPDYLASEGLALAGGEPWPVDYGPELSRGFRALKVWAHFIEHGREKLGRSIAFNCELASYLADKVDAHPQLQRMAPVSLNICCFRAIRDDVSEDALDDFNRAIVARLQSEGTAAPSTTRIDGKLVIRVNITNHRTQHVDIDILIDAINDLLAEDQL